VQGTGDVPGGGGAKASAGVPSGRARLRSALVYAGFLCALFLAVEAVFRFALPPDADLARYLFHTGMKVSRGAYLDRYPELLDTAALTRPLRPNSVYVQQVEEDRPPFDRIDHPFRVRSNELGFRDGSFQGPKEAGTRRIAFLGDSNTWGKGLEEEVRFSNILGRLLPGNVRTMNLGLEGCASDCLAEVLDRSRPLEPDLVVLQVSGNDLDQTVWRESRSTRPSAAWARVLALLSRSRFLMTTAYALFGDPFEAQTAAMIAHAQDFYSPAVERIFRTCRERGIGLVLLGLAYGDGTRFGGHYFEACRRNPDVCRGIVVEDFAHAGQWLAGAPPSVLYRGKEPDWVSRTARDMGIDEGTMAEVFPHRDLFQDIVHLNARGNFIVARQLLPLLAEWATAATPPSANPPAPASAE
jgi:lysophospholipase L1-like esterase